MYNHKEINLAPITRIHDYVNTRKSELKSNICYWNASVDVEGLLFCIQSLKYKQSDILLNISK